MAKNILILEDDKDMQEMYQMFFNDQGDSYKIDIEGKAESALKRVKEKSYDLVILDIIMEPLPGDTFFVRLRDEKKTAELPVLVVSVLSQDALALIKRINHVSFLQKPVTKEELFTEMDRILS
ncbi:MAG: response regulator [bacterium]